MRGLQVGGGLEHNSEGTLFIFCYPAQPFLKHQIRGFFNPGQVMKFSYKHLNSESVLGFI